MQTIYKYPLSLASSQGVSMPQGAKILSAQMQNDELQVWAIVDTEAPAPDDYYEFIIAGTGNPTHINIRDANYLSTVQDGGFVWHVFYRS